VLYQVGRREEWLKMIDDLCEDETSAAVDADRCVAQMTPTYGGRRVFDIGDMLELYHHWFEPETGGVA
jgi:hypothetical protein